MRDYREYEKAQIALMRSLSDRIMAVHGLSSGKGREELESIIEEAEKHGFKALKTQAEELLNRKTRGSYLSTLPYSKLIADKQKEESSKKPSTSTITSSNSKVENKQKEESSKKPPIRKFTPLYKLSGEFMTQAFDDIRQSTDENREEWLKKCRDYINELQKIYSEIKIKNISSKLGLNVEEVKDLIEDMIKKEEIDANISKNILVFNQQKSPEISEEEEAAEKEINIIIFISYALKDAEFYKISELSKKLTSYIQIKNVLYFEESSIENFVKYMNKYIGECDIMVLFCSENALKSHFVEDEWTAALALRKPIIPVFTNKDHIPPLLRARIGCEFSTSDFQKNIDCLYKRIMKLMNMDQN